MNPLFTFIHVTDTHLTAEVDVLSPFVEAVNAETFHPRPDFIVFGGDNISGDPDDSTVCERETRLLKERLDRLVVPCFMTCHTHDTRGETRPGTQYRRHFGEDAFSYIRDFPGNFRGVFMSGGFHDGGQVVDLYHQTEWLDRTLSEAGDRQVLLFAHVPFFPPRKPVPPPHDALLFRPKWQAGHFYFKPENAGQVEVIRRHGNVLAHYSGHCHVHSVTRRNGTFYVTTGSLATRPWEYRYIRVFPDRIEHRCVCPHDVRIMKLSPDKLAWLSARGIARETIERQGAFWINCVDEEHPTVELYHDGLPSEREFVIPIGAYNPQPTGQAPGQPQG